MTEVKANPQLAADAWEMTLPNKRWGFLAFFFVSLFTGNLSAHTLPISYLTLVPDGNYLHLELTLNPFELNFSPALNVNKNQPLDIAGGKSLSERILQHIKIKADGKLLSAETAGVSGEVGSHHLTLRAHYPLASSQAALSIESDLATITSASHLTEVTFGKEGQRQLARLDSQTQTASFGAAIPKTEAAVSTATNQTATGYFVILLLGAIPMIGVVVLLSKFALKHLREQPQH